MPAAFSAAALFAAALAGGAAALRMAEAQQAPVRSTRAAATAVVPVADLVILGGRVLDPASGLDAVRNVVVRVGRVSAVTSAPVAGRDTLDARGLVVAPGFIDLHPHAQDSAAYLALVRDGTTTALELEEGTGDVDAWYAARAGRAAVHLGVVVGHAARSRARLR
jgi:dihydroorotase